MMRDIGYEANGAGLNSNLLDGGVPEAPVLNDPSGDIQWGQWLNDEILNSPKAIDAPQHEAASSLSNGDSSYEHIPEEPAFIDFSEAGEWAHWLDTADCDQRKPSHAPRNQLDAPLRVITDGILGDPRGFRTSPQSEVSRLNVPGLSPTTSDYTSFHGSTSCSPLERTHSNKREREKDQVINESKKQKRPRYPRIQSGYPCPVLNCAQTFNTNGDLQKHQTRAHSATSDRRHKCEIVACKKRFHWPKDVRRHMEQVHAIVRVDKSTTAVAVANARSSIVSQPSSPVPRTNIMKTLAQSVLMLKRLRIRSGSKSSDDPVSENEKIIMVTHDKRNWMDVDLSGLIDAKTMIHRITTTLGTKLPSSTNNVKLYTYNRVLGVGKQLTNEALLTLVTKEADAQGSLRLYLETS